MGLTQKALISICVVVPFVGLFLILFLIYWFALRCKEEEIPDPTYQTGEFRIGHPVTVAGVTEMQAVNFL